MKYVIFKNKDGLETALIFPNHIPHINMANNTPRQIAHWAKPNLKCPKLGDPIAAGFLSFKPDGSILCDGCSDSLNIDSRPEDVDIIIAEINRSAYSKDPKAKYD